MCTNKKENIPITSFVNNVHLLNKLEEGGTCIGKKSNAYIYGC